MDDRELYTNPKTINIVVVSLAIFSGIGLIGTIVLCVMDKNPSLVAVVSSLAGTSIGSFSTLLANTKTMQPKVVEKIVEKA